MTSVTLYSEQPILVAGLKTVIEGLDDFASPDVFSNIGQLIEYVRAHRPNIVLLDMASTATFDVLSAIKSMGSDVPVVLWIDSASAEFVSQAIALGVRGVLKKTLPLDLQVKCLRSVAAGDLWVEQKLCEQLLTTKRVSLTRRERELVCLLAQGLKNKEIAYQLNLCEGTVKVYLSRLFDKVGANDRFELALFALKNFSASIVGDSAPNRSAANTRKPVRPSAGTFLPSFVSVTPRAAALA